MINSLDTKSRMAEKLSIPQLQAAIQNGTIPSFIGIPLLNEKVINAQKAKMASQRMQQQQQGPQPTIADQVMQQAQATAGIPALPTNLSNEQSYANGGIVAFARGGSSMSDMASQYLSDEDDDEMDYVRAILAGIGEDEYPEEEESSDEDMGEEEMGVAGMSAPSISMPMITQYMRESATAKEEGAPAQMLGREKEAVYAPISGIEPKLLENIRPDRPSVQTQTEPTGIENIKTKRSRIKSEPAASGVDDSLLAHVLHKESRGQRYDKDDKLLTSPKGAQGEMQVMPKTQMKPGFGVRPAQDNSPDEMARVGRDYLKAMQARYKEDKLAAIAYNWGPGNTDKWLMDGADPRELPAETRKYIQGLAGGGIIGLAGGGLGDIFNMTPEEAREYARRQMKIGDARAAFSAMPANSVASAPAKAGITAYDVSDEAKKIREEAARQLRRDQARSAFSASPAAAPPVAAAPTPPTPPAAPSYMDKIKALAGRAGAAASRFSPASLGLMALTPSTLNANEKEDLARHQAMPPFITTNEKLLPMKPLTIEDKIASEIQRIEDADEKGRKLSPGAREEFAKNWLARNVLPTMQTQQVLRGANTAYAQDQQDVARQNEDERKEILEGANQAVSQEQADLVPGQMQMAEDKEAGAVKKEEGVKELSGLEKLLAERMAASKQQREVDNYMALLSAGLGMMGGTSPYASANIGQGAQQGIATFQRSAAQRAQEERDILSGQLAMEKYGPLREIQREQIAAKDRQNRAALAARIDKDKEAIRQRDERLQQGNLKIYSNQLNEIRRLAQARALAKYKGSYLSPEQKEAIFADEEIKLMEDQGFRDLYKYVHKFDPGGKTPVFTYDMKNKTYR